MREVLGRFETNEAEITIKDAASLLYDQAFLAKYGYINFVVKKQCIIIHLERAISIKLKGGRYKYLSTVKFDRFMLMHLNS